MAAVCKQQQHRHQIRQSSPGSADLKHASPGHDGCVLQHYEQPEACEMAGRKQLPLGRSRSQESCRRTCTTWSIKKASWAERREAWNLRKGRESGN